MKTLSAMISTFMVWFSLTGICGVAIVVHAGDALEGHRLFFTEAQRNEAALEGPEESTGRLPDTFAQGLEKTGANHDVTPGASTDEHVRASSSNPLDSRQRHDSTARHAGPENNYQVYFTGLVTGMHGARVLVNGLPCQPESAEHRGKSDRPVPIECPGVRNDALTLTLSVGAGELLVTDADRRVHRLLPGEGI